MNKNTNNSGISNRMTVSSSTNSSPLVTSSSQHSSGNNRGGNARPHAQQQQQPSSSNSASVASSNPSSINAANKSSVGGMQRSSYPINVHLIWPIVIRPLLCKIQKRNQTAAVTLLNGLGRAENNEHGFLLELVTTILGSRDIKVNMTEQLLRLQANIPEFEEQRCRRPEEPFQELNRKTFALKKILSRIPDEIIDRKIFLETIKEIASAIKKLLDCVNRITAGGFLASYQDKKAVDTRKRDFIKDSKNFSQTLKEFFKGGHEQLVFESAAQLIYATNSIQKTIKSRCDYKS